MKKKNFFMTLIQPTCHWLNTLPYSPLSSFLLITGPLSPPPQKKKAVILYKKATISLETKFGFFGEVLGFSFFL